MSKNHNSVRFGVAVLAVVVSNSAWAGRRVYFDCDTLDTGEYRRYAQIAKELGATHLSACQIEPSMWQWNQNRYDPYPNWSMHRASVFKFVIPDELKPYLDADYCARNLRRLRERAKVLKEFGFRATFTGMEPSYLPEKAYRDHPNWRGPRCDQCRRARFEYFAPCLDDPEMREIYVKGVEMLCREAPFESFDVMCNDSGSGLCWFPRLYPGPNGPEACRDGSISDRIVNYLSVFQEGAARAGYPEMTVNFNRYCSDAIREQTLLKLKKGQSISNRSLAKTVSVHVVGFPNPFAEYSYPVYAMPRIVRVARQLQEAQADPEGDVAVSVRSLEETDMIRFMRMYFKRPIGKGQVARYAALNALAATFVGEERASELVDVWEAIESAYARSEWAQTGGHIFLLGTTHQRWLTRPLVAFPGELKPEEKDYYRAFQFQAQEEERADDMLDLQGFRWLGGMGGKFAVEGTFNLAGKEIDAAEAKAAALVAAAKDAESEKYLKGVVLKLRLYRAVMVNAQNVVFYQFLIDEARRNGFETKDLTEEGYEQGSLPWYKMNEYARSEIGNTLRIIGILEEAQKLGVTVIRTATQDEFESVMNLAPVPKLIGQLRKKIEITENHRRDTSRMYRSYNR